MKYLLDTNVLSESLKLKPDISVISKLEKHQYEIATVAPVWHELKYGCERLPRPKKRAMLELFLHDGTETGTFLNNQTTFFLYPGPVNISWQNKK